eukprot:1961805-Alexandrium_andersonii.AAC.1
MQCNSRITLLQVAFGHSSSALMQTQALPGTVGQYLKQHYALVALQLGPLDTTEASPRGASGGTPSLRGPSWRP